MIAGWFSRYNLLLHFSRLDECEVIALTASPTQAIFLALAFLISPVG